MTGLENISSDVLDAMLEALPVELTFIDKDNIILYYNREGNRLFSRSPELLGQDFTDCHSSESMKKVEPIISELKSGNLDIFDLPHEKNGRKLHTRYTAVRDEGGEYVGALQAIFDVTEYS